MAKFVIKITGIAEYLKVTRILSIKLHLKPEVWESIDQFFVPIDGSASTSEKLCNALSIEDRKDISAVNLEEVTSTSSEYMQITIGQLDLLDKQPIELSLSSEDYQKLLDTKLEETEFNTPMRSGASVRAYGCLKASKIHTLGDLIKYSRIELRKFRNMGEKALDYVEDVILHPRGLQLAKKDTISTGLIYG